jgi:outer membrane protease
MVLIYLNLIQDNMTDPIKRRRKKHLRNLTRNKSGRNATVKMATYTGGKNNKKHYAAPTITFKGNEKAKPQSFNQALAAGEVYEFRSKRRAARFAAGSWKKGKEKRVAMKAYREAKREAKRNK